MSAPPPIPNPRHTSGGADPRRPYVQRNKGGGGKVIAPFFSDDEMVRILDAIAKARGES
jgi:hypothetical protein